MRLLLIRHGETVDNVAGIYAGITDSALTNHGVLQANRLGDHLSTSGVKVSHIFSSDLQRAFKTAEAIREAQSTSPPATTKLQLLREQYFGSFEGKKFERPKDGNQSRKDAHLEAHRNDPGFVEVESKESMRSRVESFIDAHLVQLMHDVEEDKSVAVVAHGIILSHLWRAILKRFHPFVTVAPGVQAGAGGFSLEYLGGWSNTGYLDLEVKSRPDSSSRAPEFALSAEESAEISKSSQVATTLDPAVSDAPLSGIPASQGVPESSSLPQKPASTLVTSLDASPIPQSPPPGLNELFIVVKAVNSQEHLKRLKKTGGGIGSLKHDSSQKTVDSFFKRRKLDPNP